LQHGTAAAATKEEVLQNYRKHVESAQGELSATRAVLEAKPQADWQPFEIQAYQAQVLWTVQAGLLLYRYEHKEMPADPASLAGTEYVPQWPANAFNGWKPVRVLGLSDGFQPGELTLQLCPREFYSYIKNPRPMSYQLSVFGPDMDFAHYGKAQALESNTWAEVPAGALYMIGAFNETSEQSRRKLEKMQQDAAAAGVKLWAEP
jgi:hypothetical protein